MSGFLDGARVYLEAWHLLRAEPGLWRYLWRPMAVTVIAGGAFYAAALYGGVLGIAWLVAHLPAWAGVLAVALRVLLAAALVVVVAVGMARFGVLLGSPWYDALAEEIERLRLPESARPIEADFFRGLGATIGYEAKKLVFTLACGAPLLLLNLIPGLGSLLSAAGGFTLAVVILCMDMFDPYMGPRGYRFRSKLKTVLAHMPASAGFGLITLVLTSIPLVNLFTVPWSVVAASLFYCDRIAPKDGATPATA